MSFFVWRDFFGCIFHYFVLLCIRFCCMRITLICFIYLHPFTTCSESAYFCGLCPTPIWVNQRSFFHNTTTLALYPRHHQTTIDDKKVFQLKANHPYGLHLLPFPPHGNLPYHMGSSSCPPPHPTTWTCSNLFNLDQTDKQTDRHDWKSYLHTQTTCADGNNKAAQMGPHFVSRNIIYSLMV